MCCSGKCPYENWMGDCTIKCGQPYPADAACAHDLALEDDPAYTEWLDSLDELRLKDLDEEGFFDV